MANRSLAYSLEMLDVYELDSSLSELSDDWPFSTDEELLSEKSTMRLALFDFGLQT